MTSSTPLLDAQDLRVHFPVRRGPLGHGRQYVHAVDGVSLRIRRGETLGLVGESGCGKTTLGRALLRLIEPTGGEVAFGGQSLRALDRRALRQLRRRMQIVFQDPYGSLNPRMKVGSIVGEGLVVHKLARGAELRERVADLLRHVGLPADAASRYPHEFSGGQRQRIGIARALATRPDFVVCDEPVSGLDVSVQAQIINLLEDLRAEFGLSLLFISHDIRVVEHISHAVAVMYLGKIVEQAETRELYQRPLHPYTQALLTSLPSLDPKARYDRAPLEGDLPSPVNPPPGCAFQTRCPLAEDRCRRESPPLAEVAATHFAACFKACAQAL